VKSRCTDKFWELYDSLPDDIKRAADKAYKLWREDTTHLSLYFKPIPERPGEWSAIITKGYRAVCLKRPYGWLWYGIGDHDYFDRL